jgi:branched-chain amino acid transport system substrate-binding protein
MSMSRRLLLSAAGAAALARPSFAADEPILIGVCGPLTGPNAMYGSQWKDGFAMALDEVGHKVAGRPLDYVFEDSQADPRQAVAIAQKFVSDKRIVMELGDFASPASMAASPIYQRAGMVQFGFTNSHPDFTKGGTFMWSTSISQADEQPKLAEFAIDGLKLKRIAVMYINSDWGRTSKDLFTPAAKALGGEVVAAEGFQPDERDFRPTLVRVRDAKPDIIVIISYYSDAALIARAARDQGLTQPFLAASSVYSPKLIELGGAAVEGMYTHSPFSAADPRPEVQKFVADYKARFGRDADSFNVYSYDAMIMAHAAIGRAIADKGSPDRRAIQVAMGEVRDVPSVIFGKATFDPETRRVAKPRYARLVIKDGKFVAWDGVAKAS